MKRRIIKIDQEKCNGCGLCAEACHESAIAMVDGKATLIKDDYCDGLGDCLPACPTGAITFEEREAAPYDEAAVKARLEKMGKTPAQGQRVTSGCPGMAAKALNRKAHVETKKAVQTNSFSAPSQAESQLMQWPVQIKLMPINAPYYDGANLLIAADCTAYAYANFHNEFMRNRITVIGCPKLDSIDYSEKLTEILKTNNIKSVIIVRMEVPCCSGLANAAIKALQDCGKMIPWQVVTISTEGDILED